MTSPQPGDLVDPTDLDTEELYGFRWGAAVVERTDEYRMGKAKEGRRMTKIFTIRPDKSQPIEIHVSSSGSSVRVFRDGRELT